MSEQLRKIIHGHTSSDSSPNTSSVVVKNEIDIVNYAENNQMDPTEIYYGRSSYRRDSHFNNSWEKINRIGRRQGHKNKTRSTNKKKLNPQDRTGNITVRFNCGCRFYWSCDCPYVHSSRNKDGVEVQNDFSLSHVVLAGTCLNFEDDTVTMLKKKIPLSCTSLHSYYQTSTIQKFKHIPLIKEISSKNMAEKN